MGIKEKIQIWFLPKVQSSMGFIFVLAAFAAWVTWAQADSTYNVGTVGRPTNSSQMPSTARGYNPTPGIRDWHLVQAELYESRVAAMDQLIQEHQRMKAEYKAKGYVGDMNTHCDAVIRDQQKLKTDYLNFASWHRSQAAQNVTR